MKIAPLNVDLIKRAVTTLTEAFVDDPFYVYLLPSERARRRWLRTYMKATLKMTLRSGHVYAAEGPDVPGVIVTLAPGQYPPTRRRLYPFVLRMLGAASLGIPAPWRLRALIRALEMVDSAHLVEPHWYIYELAVSAEHRGRGIGRLLLDKILEQADATFHPVYLETTNEANLGLYRHFGFELVETLRCPGVEPPIWTMLRPPNEPRAEKTD